jgi:hypothetical protein
MSTLPDDVKRRRAVIASLIESLDPIEVPDALRDSLGDLDRHLAVQRDLQSELFEATNPTGGSARLGYKRPRNRGAADDRRAS